jgi:hypothetical protein
MRILTSALHDYDRQHATLSSRRTLSCRDDRCGGRAAVHYRVARPSASPYAASNQRSTLLVLCIRNVRYRPLLSAAQCLRATMLEARLRRAEYLSPPTLSLNADPDRDLSPNKRMDTMSNLMRYSLTIGLSCTAIIQAYAASATAPFDPGNPNWVKITGQDCWMYTFRLTDDSVTWTGSCSERCASGSGTATWHDTSGSVTAIIKGTQVNGVFKGKEVYDGHSTDGSQFHWEGRIENGKMQGNALYESYKNGTLVYRYVGNVVDGVQNGQGRATTYAYGTITSEFNGIWQDGRPATANNVASASPSDSSSTQTYPTAIPRSVAPAAADQSADHDADTRTISAFSTR